MSEFRADLHCHTTCSDGSLSPVEIVKLAKELGLSALSITDHDTVNAYATAVPAAKELNLTLITGVEFSTSLKGNSIHILGYGFQLDHPEIAQLCAKHIIRRKERNHVILELLKKHQMPVSQQDLEEAASHSCNGKGTIGRPHIALAMVKKGYVASVHDAFKKFIGEDRPCYYQGTPFSVEETVEVIHHAKGVAVIAHPHLINNNEIFKLLLEMKFDGIECYYGNFFSADHQRWLKIAAERKMLVTGGSDFHGSIKPNVPLGCSWINEEAFLTLQSTLNNH